MGTIARAGSVERVTKWFARPLQKYVAGDVGGTNLRLALVTSRGEILERTQVDMARFTSSHDLATYCVPEIARLIGTEDVSVGGIGFPCAMGPDGDPVTFAPNVGYTFGGFISKLDQELSKQGIRLQFLGGFNDVRDIVAGEAHYGIGQTFWKVFAHWVGTGYGAKLIDGEQEVLPYAFEWGHLKASSPFEGGPYCNCGAYSDAESYTSGIHLSTRYRERYRIKNNENADGVETGEDVGRLFLQDDPVALYVMERAMEALAVSIANAHALTLYDTVHIVGGGVAKNGPKMLDLLKDKLRDLRVVPFRRDGDVNELPGRVALTELGEDAGLLGAGVVAQRTYEERQAIVTEAIRRSRQIASK